LELEQAVVADRARRLHHRSEGSFINPFFLILESCVICRMMLPSFSQALKLEWLRSSGGFLEDAPS
jgi:hypothetical protein